MYTVAVLSSLIQVCSLSGYQRLLKTILELLKGLIVRCKDDIAQMQHFKELFDDILKSEADLGTDKGRSTGRHGSTPRLSLTAPLETPESSESGADLMGSAKKALLQPQVTSENDDKRLVDNPDSLSPRTSDDPDYADNLRRAKSYYSGRTVQLLDLFETITEALGIPQSFVEEGCFSLETWNLGMTEVLGVSCLLFFPRDILNLCCLSLSLCPPRSILAPLHYGHTLLVLSLSIRDLIRLNSFHFPF